MRFTIKLKLRLSAVFLTLIVLSFVIIEDLSFEKGKVATDALEVSNSERLLIKELQIEVINVWQYLTDASLTQDSEVVTVDAAQARDRGLKISDELLLINSSYTANVESFLSSFNSFWDVGLEMKKDYSISKALGDIAMEKFDTAGENLYKRLDALGDPIIERRALFI